MLAGGLTWLLIPLGVWASLKLFAPGAPTWTVQSETPCSAQAPALWINGRPEQIKPASVVMATSSTLFQRVCQPGTLTFQARGTAVQGGFPLVSVAVGARTLLTTRVDQPRTYQVRVPEAGTVTLTFHDDAYAPKAHPPEDRNLFVSRLRFSPGP